MTIELVQPYCAHPRTRLRVDHFLGRVTTSLVGAVFLLAGFLKAADSSSLARVLAFDGFVKSLSFLLWLVPLWEIGLGAGLILYSRSRLLIWLALGTLVLFIGQLVFLLVSTGAPDCGCIALLNRYHDAQWSHMFGIARNVIMITGLACSLVALRCR